MKSARWYLPSLDPADGEDKVSVSVDMSSVAYTLSSTFLVELNSCAADFKLCCMATLAQSIWVVCRGGRTCQVRHAGEY